MHHQFHMFHLALKIKGWAHSNHKVDHFFVLVHYFNRGLLEELSTQLGSPPPSNLSQQRFNAVSEMYLNIIIKILCLICFSWPKSNSLLSAPLSATCATQGTAPIQESVAVNFVKGKTVFVMNFNKLNLMTRTWCWSHIYTYTEGHVCVICRCKHITRKHPRPELVGVDLRHRLSQDEWQNVRDVDNLK